LRLYISADIEGIVGVVTRDHLAPEGFEYERARDWMTDTVVAACEAAHEAGATEIVVSDSHGNGESLKIEKLPDYTQIVRSWPRPLTMMQGVEVGEFAGALLIGYHAGASNRGGVLSHTLSGSAFQEVRVNGQVLNEAGLNAAIAGHFGVPVIYASGDDVAVAEIRDIVGDIETTTVKWAHSTRSARSLTPAVAHAAVREGVKRAIARIGEAKPFRLKAPMALEVRFRHRLPVEHLAYLRFITQVDTYTIRYEATDAVDLSKFLMFLFGYSATATM
jgi:D-amino peptidase